MFQLNSSLCDFLFDQPLTIFIDHHQCLPCFLRQVRSTIVLFEGNARLCAAIHSDLEVAEFYADALGRTDSVSTLAFPCAAALTLGSFETGAITCEVVVNFL